MTARQRLGTGSTVTIAPTSNGSATGTDRGIPLSWEEWFSHATPPQRASALNLAQLHGLLYAHQLPATTNGKVCAPNGHDTALSRLLGPLFAGKIDVLPALPIESVNFFDAGLDCLQRQAVLRALDTPDLFLLQGLPGPGRARVVTEIVLQSAARGRRVLHLALETRVLDEVLQSFVGHPEVLALRHLDPLERPEKLSPQVRGYTQEAQTKVLLEHMQQGARAQQTQAETTCRQHRDREPVWTELHGCLERHEECGKRLQLVRDLLSNPRDGDNVAPNIETSRAERLGQISHEYTQHLDELDRETNAQMDSRRQYDHDTGLVNAQIASLTPAYQAKKRSQFWSLAFWRNLFNGQVIAEMGSLQERLSEIQSHQVEITQRLAALDAQRRDRQAQFDAERLAILGDELQSLEDKQHQIDLEWEAIIARLNVGPIEKNSAALTTAHQTWMHQQQLTDEQCRFAQQWLAYIEEAGNRLAARLPSFANLVACTLQSWKRDAKFRDALGGPLDLLIVDSADVLTEPDLTSLARYAHRIALFGAPTTAGVSAPKLATTTRASSGSCWNRLWQLLEEGAPRWPNCWYHEADRLVCQLIPITTEDRQHLEREGLADAADIELRILHRPHTAPCLAQVTFPSNTRFEDAFGFMIREVQEFPVEPLGLTAWWAEEDQRITRHLGAHDGANAIWIDVESGVRLATVPVGASKAPRVACIEFDKSAGWDRARADAWLGRFCRGNDLERTVVLQATCMQTAT